MDITLAYSLCAFVWGALWGSFLNVVVHRLPRGESVVSPPSHCPSCDREIPWYDNIPLLSYVVLNARCRKCGAHIKLRYFALELVTATLSMMLFIKVATAADIESQLADVVIVFLFYFVFVCAIIAIAAIDFELTLIPDSLTIPTAVLGVISAAVIGATTDLPEFHPAVTWLDSVIGLVGSVAFLALIFYGYKLVTGRVGLGGGDFTLIGMIGAFLGWISLPIVLFLASIQGLLFAGAMWLAEKVLGRKILLRGVHKPEFWEAREAAGGPTESEEQGSESDEKGVEADPDDEKFGRMGVPFGPFLGIAALEYLFFGRALETLMLGGAF